MRTPPLPTWIRNARVAGYTTAHELCPGETRLYGTEDLYGDWEGEVLLLAKDWGPSSILHRRLANGEEQSYRHEPKMRANRRVRELADPLAQRGLLYGSALANLLRDDGRVSGSLPNRMAAMAYGIEVTRFAIEHMPRLRWIVCLGREAWEVATAAERAHGSWKQHRDAAQPLGRLIAAYHPSARVSRERIRMSWRTMV